jgi:hypothetical protein
MSAAALCGGDCIAYMKPMGHSRQDGGFAEAPLAPVAGNLEIPVGPRARLKGLRPDFVALPMFTPRSDTNIEKESAINEQIDRMRHSATRALLARDDVVVVAA